MRGFGLRIGLLTGSLSFGPKPLLEALKAAICTSSWAPMPSWKIPFEFKQLRHGHRGRTAPIWRRPARAAPQKKRHRSAYISHDGFAHPAHLGRMASTATWTLASLTSFPPAANHIKPSTTDHNRLKVWGFLKENRQGPPDLHRLPSSSRKAKWTYKTSPDGYSIAATSPAPSTKSALSTAA